MTRRDLLDHPELKKAWVALESSAPVPEWDEIQSTDGVEPTLTPARPGRRRSMGIWVGVAVAIWVMILFSPGFFISGSDPVTEPGGAPTSPDDFVPSEEGFLFANPEHVQVRFTQELTLICENTELVDNGGFDSFDLDIWIDHQTGFTRLGFDYPDGSSHDLILQGTPNDWEHAWSRGTELGRSAGCREAEDGGYSQSVAGWAFQDSSDLWFGAYLKPAYTDSEGVFINHETRPTQATPIGARTYEIENEAANGTLVRFEFTLDESGHRVVGEKRHVSVPGDHVASATIEVLETGPAPMPAGVFDLSDFTPLWGDGVVVTTASETP